MTLTLRKSEDRGHTRIQWLDSRHTFSFSDYYDPKFINFGVLRVINEDYVQPSKGFNTHSHRDMEIISIVLSGAVEHRDNMGNGSIIYPGDIQLMSAGTGVSHSEFNPSSDQLAHFLQIWIEPDQRGLTPSYGQKTFDASACQNQWQLVVSGDAEADSLFIHQDVRLYKSVLATEQTLTYALSAGRMGWLQVARGSVLLSQTDVDDQPLTLEAGDGVGVTVPLHIHWKALHTAELYWFDLPQ